VVCAKDINCRYSIDYGNYRPWLIWKLYWLIKVGRARLFTSLAITALAHRWDVEVFLCRQNEVALVSSVQKCQAELALTNRRSTLILDLIEGEIPGRI
jgi:hypothetical protein